MEGKTGVTEFSDAELDRVLAEARATLESIRARRPGPAADASGGAEEGAGDGPPEGTGTAADGRITVTAAPGGRRITAVELDPEAMRLSSEEFGRQLVLAVNAALDDARVRGAAPPVDGETEDGADGDAEQDPGLRQMALLTRAINEALARIG